MQLRLESRPVGEVFVVQCIGRMVAGNEIFTLHSQVGDAIEKYGDVAGMMMVHECHEQMRVAIEANSGHFIKTIGDAVMATFTDSANAVRGAIAMQMAMNEFNATEPTDQ